MTTKPRVSTFYAERWKLKDDEDEIAQNIKADEIEKKPDTAVKTETKQA